MSDPVHVISLGAGVQSSVMYLLAEMGELTPRPDEAIFADTQWEPDDVYRHLEWLESVSDTIPIERVTAGNIRENEMRGVNATGHRFTTMPLFTKPKGMGLRNCTYQYKLRPIRNRVKQLMGYDAGERVVPRPHVQAVSWLGITVDEAQRMKKPRSKWWDNRYPLVELGWSRQDCLAWFAEHFPHRQLPRSACVACPYRSTAEWRAIRADPKMWKDAVEFDRAIRHAGDHESFVHQSRKPLEEVDLRTAEEAGQTSLWGNECEGMCGV